MFFIRVRNYKRKEIAIRSKCTLIFTAPSPYEAIRCFLTWGKQGETEESVTVRCLKKTELVGQVRKMVKSNINKRFPIIRGAKFGPPLL